MHANIAHPYIHSKQKGINLQLEKWKYSDLPLRQFPAPPPIKWKLSELTLIFSFADFRLGVYLLNECVVISIFWKKEMEISWE